MQIIFLSCIKRKILRILLAFFIFTLLFSACKKTENFNAAVTNAPLVLTSTDSVLVLNEANKNNTAVTFNWTRGSNYGTSANISYRLEIDKKGNHFAGALKNNIGTAIINSIYTVDAINTLLLSYWSANPGIAFQLEARIIDSVAANGIKTDTSNVISLTITPYKPVSKTLYIIGDATSTGWDLNSPSALTLDPITPGLFTYQGLLTSGQMEFITTLGSLLPSYVEGADSIHIVLRNSNSVPDNRFTINTAKVYQISVNIIKLTISISELALPLYSQLWIVGAATPNGWDINNPNQMKVDVFNAFIFRYNEVLAAGEFKIPTALGNWGGDFYRPLTNHPPITDTTAALVQGLTNPPDNKWQISTPGPYKIALNISTNSIHIIPFTPFTSLWLVGDATATGWNINNPTPIVPTPGDPYTFTFTGPLTAGEFKIPVTTGNFGCPYFRPEINHPNISDTNAPYVPVLGGLADANDYKWYISIPGNYKIPLNQLYETISIQKQ